MSRHGWRPTFVDLVEVDEIEVDLVEDEPVDEYLALLHEIALEAIALRAHSPGDPRVEPEARPAGGPDPDPPGLLRRLGRRRVVLAAVAVVAAVAVAVAPGLVATHQAATRLAALTASPAVLASAASPPGELWRAPGRVVGDLPTTLLAGGATDGSLQRLDPASGEATWTVPNPGASPVARCFPVGEDATTDAGSADPALVACVAGPTAADPDFHGPTDVTVLNPRTGMVARTVEQQGALLVAEPVGEDLLVATRLSDGRLSAARWDVGSPARVWTYTSRQPVLSAAEGAAVQLGTDALVVEGVALDLATGEARTPAEGRRVPARVEEHTLPGGAHVTWTWYPDGASGQGRVTSDHGTRVFAILGPPLVPALTDGSLASTLVVTTPERDHLRGVDLRTGRLQWIRPYLGAASVRATVQVDGVLVLDDGATATAIDVRTGEDLWSTPVDPQVGYDRALTDGRVVLLPEPGASGPELVARGIADGAVTWRVALPTGTVALTVVDQRLVASAGDVVVGLG